MIGLGQTTRCGDRLDPMQFSGFSFMLCAVVVWCLAASLPALNAAVDSHK